MLASLARELFTQSLVDIAKIFLDGQRRAAALRARNSVPLFKGVLADGRSVYVRACSPCAVKMGLAYLPADRGKKRAIKTCELCSPCATPGMRRIDPTPR